MSGLPQRARRFPLALAIGASVAIVAAAQDSDLTEKLYLSGERAFHAHSYAEAFETWNQLLQASPKSHFAAQALLRMARYHVDVEKNPDAALPFLERLKTEHIKSPLAADASDADEVSCACSLRAKAVTPSRRAGFWLAGAGSC